MPASPSSPSPDVTADTVVAGLTALARIDGPGLLRALEQIPPDVYFDDAADVLGWVEKFIPLPPLTIAEDACLVLAIIARGYEQGLIKSADPQEPELLKAAGPDNFTD